MGAAVQGAPRQQPPLTPGSGVDPSTGLPGGATLPVMDERSAGVARLFDMLAADYDRSGVDFFEPIAAGLLEVLPPRPGERWLDVGCGAGAVLLPVADAVGADGTVVGIDVSEQMVERTRAAARGLPHVEVLVGDAAEPPAADPFDVVVSSLVLFFLPDPDAALRSWLGALAPGGRLGVSTFGPWDPRLEDVEAVLEPWIPAAMKDPRVVGEASPFASDEGMERLVADAGFVEVRTETFALPVRFADAEQWYAFSWSTGQRGMWLSVPEDQRDAVRAEAFRRFASYAGDDGSLVAAIPIRCTLASAPS